MKIKRSIGVYEKEGDSLIEDIVIDLPVDFLIHLFQADTKEDPDFYKVYLINKGQFVELKKSIPKLSKFDFDSVEMYLECFSLD